jgi:hypothetical protein
VYSGLADAVTAGNRDTNQANLEHQIILPSTFQESVCNMQQNCQDALAINQYF